MSCWPEVKRKLSANQHSSQKLDCWISLRTKKKKSSYVQIKANWCISIYKQIRSDIILLSRISPPIEWRQVCFCFYQEMVEFPLPSGLSPGLSVLRRWRRTWRLFDPTPSICCTHLTLGCNMQTFWPQGRRSHRSIKKNQQVMNNFYSDLNPLCSAHFYEVLHKNF